MAVDVYAADEQQQQPVELERWVTLAQSVLTARGVKGDAEVSLLFVDEPSIASLNEQFLQKEGPTDVLSFPIEDEPLSGGRFPDFGGTGPGSDPPPSPVMLLGDVVVCPAVAARNAVDHGVTYDDEMALLVVHGLLHLLGMDHVEEAEAERMERMERQLLRRFYRATYGAEHSESDAAAASADADDAADAAAADDGTGK
jgi:probable rRNA maturation factor